jgi:hypothetical protein
MKRLVAVLFLLPSICFGTIYTAASPALTDVTAVATTTGNPSLADGDTVVIPAGIATWTSGISITKAIKIIGAGSGRIVAYDNQSENLTIGTGALTVVIWGYSPGFSSSSFSVGQTLRVYETNSRNNWMQGVVTAWSSPNLTINVTSTGGSGTTHRWLISTLPLTTITANGNGGGLFSLHESTVGNVDFSGLLFNGTPGASGGYLVLAYTTGGKPILVHDCWFQFSNNNETIDSNTNRGVVWNCSFDGSSGNPGSLKTGGSVRIKDPNGTNIGNSWSTASTWGSADATGTGALYVETCDFHTTIAACDIDDYGRMVWRYNLMDHAAYGTHGADTSAVGQRYFEYYNNTGNYSGRSDGTTFNMGNGWIGLVRGGTFVCHDNTLTAMTTGTDYHQSDIHMTVMDLQRATGGARACWGAGTTAGSLYPFPRQCGFGYVTGSGTDGKGESVNPAGVYVGDSEPIYIWNNSRTLTVSLSDFGVGGSGECPASPVPEVTSDYIASGRDYKTIAKPGYTPYTYPHPLTGGLSAPVITTANSVTWEAGTVQTFDVCGVGNPTPSLSESGSMPTGTTFNDNGVDGTCGSNDHATIAAAASTVAGTSSITITAHNSQSPDATQTFTFTFSSSATKIITWVNGNTLTFQQPIFVGQYYSLPRPIRNTGNATANVSSISDSDTTNCSSFMIGSVAIAPVAFRNIVVGLIPRSSGSHSETVTVNGDWTSGTNTLTVNWNATKPPNFRARKRTMTWRRH